MNWSAIGISTISSAQRALDLVGQNIANAATPGYHRQAPALVDRVYDGVHGIGVEVKRVIRYADDLLRRGILNSSGETGFAQTRLEIETRIETALVASGIDNKLGALFDRIQHLAARPDDITARRGVLAAAADLAGALNQLADDLTQIRNSVRQSIEQTVGDVNSFTTEIASLNLQIARVEMTGRDANDLRNQRDLLIEELSKKIDVRVVPQEYGQVNVYGAGTALVLNDTPTLLNADIDGSGNFFIYADNPLQPLTVASGELSALLQEYNVAIPGYAAQLDGLAVGLIQSIDEVQATGLGLNGPMISALGHRGVDNVALPLVSAGLDIPPQAGDLYISVTTLATGVRTLTSINIDPTTQSLQDIANAITTATGGQVQASIDLNYGTLQLQASPGFAFDFAGRLPTAVDSVGMNGTSIPALAGTYMGGANDIYTFTVLGSGTVGVTPGLTLEVRNGAGALLNTINIGAGYTPDTLIHAADGISFRLSAGTTNNGSFSSRVIAEPDTAGILPSLGINSIFTGASAATIGVRGDLLTNPALLSASRNGNSADARNIERLAALRDQPLLAGNTLTFEGYSHNLLGLVGSEVRATDLRHQASQTLLNGLQQQEQSIIGVDINEEMVKLLEFQRMLQSGVQYLSVVNKALDEILNIVR